MVRFGRHLRSHARRVLDSTGLLDASRAVRRRAWLALDAGLREHDRQNREAFPAFRDANAARLRGSLHSGSRTAGSPALVIGSKCPTLESELAVIKALQLGGYAPTVVVRDSYRGLRPYYELADVAGFRTWSEYSGSSTLAERESARIMARCRTVSDLRAVVYQDVRVGLIALSTAIRRRRVGAVDLANAADRDDLTRRVAMSIEAIAEAGRILDSTRPGLGVFVDTEYTPTAELFELCLARGIPSVAYDAGHRSNSLIFKRYTTANRTDHLSTLAPDTWERVRTMPFSSGQREALDGELSDRYGAGDWYRACWTQAHTHGLGAAALRERLGLRSGRKAAFVFAHILWDAPMSWGHTLFPTYEDWLIETARAAIANPSVDWLIKIHPANQGKQAKEGYEDEPAETRILRSMLGQLPPHVRVLPPSFDVSTPSLFPVMDWCLTVRGTVGIEAARLGIPVLTAGPGRYGSLGFTIDSDTPDEYRRRLARISEVDRLSAAQVELAERYAYAFFMLKPFEMTSVTWDYGSLGDRTTSAIHVRDGASWSAAPDIARLSRWLSDSDAEDLLA